MHREFVDAHLPKDILELFDNLTVTAVMLGYHIKDSASFYNNHTGIHYDYRFEKENGYLFFLIDFYFDIISDEKYKFNRIAIHYSPVYFNRINSIKIYKNIDNIKKVINKLLRCL